MEWTTVGEMEMVGLDWGFGVVPLIIDPDVPLWARFMGLLPVLGGDVVVLEELPLLYCWFRRKTWGL